MPATVDTFFLGCLGQISYAVYDSTRCFLIDPRLDVGPYRDYLKQRSLTLAGVILTHIHADFVSGHAELSRDFKVPIYIGRGAGARFEGAVFVRDGDVIELSSNNDIVVMETPGHTMGCVTFLLLADKLSGVPGGAAPAEEGTTGDKYYHAELASDVPHFLSKNDLRISHAFTGDTVGIRVGRPAGRTDRTCWPAGPAGECESRSSLNYAVRAVPPRTVSHIKTNE